MPAPMTEPCSRCYGTRWIRCDEWRSRRCPDCCLHGAGVWPAADEADTFVCNAGCGATWDSPNDYYGRGL
jgi:hypothetical protein